MEKCIKKCANLQRMTLLKPKIKRMDMGKSNKLVATRLKGENVRDFVCVCANMNLTLQAWYHVRWNLQFHAKCARAKLGKVNLNRNSVSNTGRRTKKSFVPKKMRILMWNLSWLAVQPVMLSLFIIDVWVRLLAARAEKNVRFKMREIEHVIHKCW